jgi:trehalose/maltose hydrolase-like predicted phosphorylase
MFCRIFAIPIIAAGLFIAGCQSGPPSQSVQAPVANPHDIAAAANRQFLQRTSYDPWVLTAAGTDQSVPAYLSDGKRGCLVDKGGMCVEEFAAGRYINAQLTPVSGGAPAMSPGTGPWPPQSLDLRTGILQTGTGANAIPFRSDIKARDWSAIWSTSDVIIGGDPEAQQVVHANLFYLLSSTCPGSRHSIPPMGLSSTDYGGHIFWDADTWMFPVLIVQHPDDARSIVDYRFDTLAAACKNARTHGLPGAEYAWESAGTGDEVAPAEFALERHITADVALAAWQYYLWTGDNTFLRTEGWPILEASAEYWAKRATKGADGAYHINHVLPPDENAGPVDDDAYTNGAARAALMAATDAAKLLHTAGDSVWQTVAAKMAIPTAPGLGFPAEYAGMPSRLAAKQADTLLLLYPLDTHLDSATAGKMLDYYAAHTILNGPAMTSGIHAVIAARLGRSADALGYFRDSYRPFMRGPWDAMSEKRSTDNVYFLTGMAGSLQSVLYGFAGLRVVPAAALRGLTPVRGGPAGETVPGRKLAGDSVASLYADPHLPPGWGKLVIQGIHFRGKVFDLTVDANNNASIANR